MTWWTSNRPSGWSETDWIQSCSSCGPIQNGWLTCHLCVATKRKTRSGNMTIGKMWSRNLFSSASRISRVQLWIHEPHQIWSRIFWVFHPKSGFWPLLFRSCSISSRFFSKSGGIMVPFFLATIGKHDRSKAKRGAAAKTKIKPSINPQKRAFLKEFSEFSLGTVPQQQQNIQNNTKNS